MNGNLNHADSGRTWWVCDNLYCQTLVCSSAFWSTQQNTHFFRIFSIILVGVFSDKIHQFDWFLENLHKHTLHLFWIRIAVFTLRNTHLDAFVKIRMSFVEVLRHVLPESAWFRFPFTGDYGHINQNQSLFSQFLTPPILLWNTDLIF